MRTTQIIIASKNKGKIAEFKELLSGFPVDIKGLPELPPIQEPIEDGNSFEENAYKKAFHTARIIGLPAIADDSGLVVPALNGAPGIYSARYGGEDATDEENNRKLLKEMEGKTNRKAIFVCVLCIAVPSGPALTYEGRCEGEITQSPMGQNGFGYDPVFYYPPYKKTFAQMSPEEKNMVSHRAMAMNQLKKEFDKVLIWLNRVTGSNPFNSKFKRVDVK